MWRLRRYDRGKEARCVIFSVQSKDVGLSEDILSKVREAAVFLAIHLLPLHRDLLYYAAKEGRFEVMPTIALWCDNCHEQQVTLPFHFAIMIYASFINSFFVSSCFERFGIPFLIRPPREEHGVCGDYFRTPSRNSY